MILLSPLSGLSVPHFTARANPIGGAIIYLKSIFRNGPNLLSFAIETKIQNPLTSNRRHTPKGRETPKQSQQNRKKGKTREISPRDPGFKSQRPRQKLISRNKARVAGFCKNSTEQGVSVHGRMAMSNVLFCTK
jgi:hypothetical protein